ncbi:CDP-glycerol glycerophosphotransferase family protein [Bacillus sp. THAF10]|uniref:CDP-glycerol glycerophosphotransferase family protein n=1 Tax=Bacillus sp. THAF10 TaxID=2587848 RepID=UPI0012690BC6|nr:CDP-glycerol glycerophosphotransferase family protein [Bacillus sp. THAF10]
MLGKTKIIQWIYKKLFDIIAKVPAKKKIIVFESFMGKQYSCNPRAIYEYLKVQPSDYVIFWSVDKRYRNDIKETDLNILSRFSLQWLWIMPRATYWVTNSRLPEWIKKPKNTVYLQTWHGTPLKKLGVDIEEVVMPGTTTENYKKNFLKETKKWDYLIAPNQYSAEIFQRAFGFEGNMLVSGYPRNDYLINENNQHTIEQIKKKLGIPSSKKVILYAPTWRDDLYYEVGKYKMKLQLDLEQMYHELKEDYVIILRMHYLVSENLSEYIDKFKGFVYDTSNYEDIKELYLISDLLITDYSSVFFDYLCLDRPILFFTYDFQKYQQEIRGFYFDLHTESPGPLLVNTAEILAAIRGLEAKNFKVEEPHFTFKQKFCELEDGHATKRVVETVFNT